MKLIFIRHGETKTNQKGLIHKTKDYSKLTTKGREQIKKTAIELKKYNIDILYTSPEIRARESAELIAKKLNLKSYPLNTLSERNWGKWEGKTWNEISQKLYIMTLEKRYTFIPPNGESWKQMESRLKYALAVITKKTNSTACIVTHGGSLRGLIPILNNSSKQDSFKYNFDNGSLTIFEHNQSLNKLYKVVINNTSHLK